MEHTIPEQAFIALRELSDKCYPDIDVITPNGRNYLHSGLIIALTYYEQYQKPVAEGHVRYIYFTTGKEFPHSPIFTHVDHPYIDVMDLEKHGVLIALNFIAGITGHRICSAKVITPWARKNLPCYEMPFVDSYAIEYPDVPEGHTRIYYAERGTDDGVYITHRDFETELLPENVR